MRTNKHFVLFTDWLNRILGKFSNVLQIFPIRKLSHSKKKSIKYCISFIHCILVCNESEVTDLLL